MKVCFMYFPYTLLSTNNNKHPTTTVIYMAYFLPKASVKL